MREFQARKKQHATVKKVIHSKWFLVILCFFIFLLAKGLIRMYGKYTIVRDNFNELDIEMSTLQARERELDTQIHHIENEQGKDYEIRKKLDVVKPGEKVLYIMDTP